jgi:hypothetical protein
MPSIRSATPRRARPRNARVRAQGFVPTWAFRIILHRDTGPVEYGLPQDHSNCESFSLWTGCNLYDVALYLR